MQKFKILVLTGENRLNVVRKLSKHEISQSESIKKERSVFFETDELFQFRRDKIFENSFSLFVDSLIVDDFVDLFQNVIDHLDNHEDSSSFFDVFTEKFLAFLGSFDDVLADSSGFSQLQVAINEIGKVGEFKTKRFFIFSEPLLRLFVLNIFPGHSDIS